jgi:hypothetical protein
MRTHSHASPANKKAAHPLDAPLSAIVTSVKFLSQD